MRFRDDENLPPSIILCRGGIFLEPHGGWEKQDRLYFVVKHDTARNNSRFSRFENYRQNLERNRNENSQRRRRNDNNANEHSGMIKLHVGRGQFKNGTFKKLTANSLGGGIVVIGPFPKDKNCVNEIRDQAFRKFQSIHRDLRKKIKTSEEMTLVYPDGTKVLKLPDGSADFTIKGYRDFLDPNKKYDRLRLYLVETDEIVDDAEEDDIEIISEESSDSLPDLRDVESRSLAQIVSNSQQTISHEQPTGACYSCGEDCGPTTQTPIDLTNEDTLPLEIRIRFISNGNLMLTGNFNQSASIEALVEYIRRSGIYHGRFQLSMNGEELEPTSPLYNYCTSLNEVVEIEVTPVVERTDRVFARLGRRRLSLRPRPQTADLPDHNNLDTNTENGPEVNVSEILKNHAEEFLSNAPNEDTIYFNNLSISRYYVLEDFFEYLDGDYDIRKKIKVTFISTFGEHQDMEVAIDEGGPRREFFRLLIEALALTSGLFEGPDTAKVFSAKVSALKNRHYYKAGYAVAASLLMGGQVFCCLAPSIVDYIINLRNIQPIPIEDVMDYEIKMSLYELKNAQSTTEMRNVIDEKLEVRFQMGVDKPTSMICLDDKNEILNDICLSYVIHRTTAAIHQFMDGLEALGMLSLLRRHNLRSLLEYSESFDVDAERMKKALSIQFSPLGSNKRPIEERVAKRLIDYIEDIHSMVDIFIYIIENE